ncbi:SERTA domain-containing protein 3 [Sciurus carolinensis]|uniref:SERTA domain-containing protein 3 n=1 Tax=Sciurus carolinensis TaxID=30640 RepID=A0AA41T511_SCICA|nr:SERTA domain-containing protein 3 [Sciurus carolinensis]
MVGGLKRKHPDLEEEDKDEKWYWSPRRLWYYHKALLSLDKVQGTQPPQACSHPQHPTAAPGHRVPGSNNCPIHGQDLFQNELDFSLSAITCSILRELETSMEERRTS